MAQTTISNFDDGTVQGWALAYGEAGATLAASTAHAYDGTYSLRTTKTVPGGAPFTSRINAANPGGGTSGNVCDARVYLGAASPDAGGWSARFWFGDNTFGVHAASSLIPITAGAWTLVSSDFSADPIPSDYDSVGIEIFHDLPSAGTVTWYVDQVRRGTGDTTAPAATIPVISNVARTVTPTQLIVTWTTDVPATSQVAYGATSGYGSTTTLDTTLVTSHSVTISGLSNSTTYHFKPISTTAAGTSVYSTDNTATTSAAGAVSTVRFGVHWVDWMQGQAVPWSALTHLHLFSGAINANGSITHTWGSSTRASLVSAAHSNGKKIIYVLGGQGRCDGLSSALTSSRAAFVSALAALVTSEGFDGLDFDFEGVPFTATDVRNFLAALRTALGGTPELYLTVDWFGTAPTYVACQPYLTQINPMTYLMQGRYTDGWSASTHHSPIVNSGSANGLPSVSTVVNDYIAAGWSPAKIGIGGSWTGKRYQGRTAPGQATDGSEGGPTAEEIDYADIKGSEPGTYHDNTDWGPWLQQTGQFVSYDDETSTPRKFDYATSRGLGGLFVWYGQAVRGAYTAPFTAMASKLAAVVTPPADTTPPVISNVQVPVATLTATGAVISWATNEAASYVLKYGPTTAYGSQVTSATRNTSQSATLANLTGNTTYYYRIEASDAAGNVGAATGSFATAAPVVAPTPPPVLGPPTVSALTTTGATVAWTTDVASDSTVEYGTSTAYGATASVPALVTGHTVALAGLTPNTTYHYRARAKRATGEEGIGTDSTLTTAATPAVVIGGTLTFAPSGLNPSAVPDGTVVTITPVPNTGSAFSRWVVDGATVTTTPLTVTMSGDHSVTVYWKAA